MRHHSLSCESCLFLCHEAFQTTTASDDFIKNGGEAKTRCKHFGKNPKFSKHLGISGKGVTIKTGKDGYLGDYSFANVCWLTI